MAKKNIKIWGRKALSLLLTLTMLTGMLQIPAMAASYEDQTMDGYYIINENGNQGLAEKGVESVTEDGYTLTKTIEQTGKDAFDITLTVETSQTVTTSDAAIQLVIDTSSSMRNNCGDCRPGERHDRSHRNRLEAIKDILADENGFLDSLTSANSGKVYVSVVYFNAGAGTAIDWTDIKTEAGLAAVKNAVENLPEATGTNIHAGLMLARNRLGMDAVSSAGAKYTVLLSDGEAHHSSNESTSTTSISGGGYGNATTKAAAMAEAVAAISAVYAVGYGVQKSYLESIVGAGDHVLVGEDSATINAAFANIAQSATEGMSGAGTSVTDPMGQSNTMGQYIVLGDVSHLAAKGVTANGNAISWALDPAKAETRTEGDTTYYTYSVTYPITLDTSLEGFEEGVYYPANGHTWLGVPQADGSVKKISFLVPGVCGTIPAYEWSVEYYLQDESSINADEATYTLDDTDDMGEAKLHSSVSAPEGFESKYERRNYTFAQGETVLKITADEEKNVIRLYYDLITAPVTEKHYYKTTTITPDGETVVGEYIEDPDKTSTVLAVIDSKYEASEQPEFGGVYFDFDEANPRNKTVTVDKDGKNLIELFYSRTDDQRVETSAQVNHVYTLYTYELNEDGKYELTAHAPVVEEKVQYSENLRATTVYNVSDAPKAGYEGYELNTEEGDYAELVQADESLRFVLQDAAEDNIRTLYFDKVVDTREAMVVTVEHYYTKNITAIEDGAVVNYNDPDNVLGLTETFDVYVGERFEAVEENEYNGETYNSDESNVSKLVIDALTGEVTVQLYYDKSVAPEKASVIANHTWRTYTEVTVELTEEVVNEETGETESRVIGTDAEVRESIDHEIAGIEYTGLYDGQKHIEAQKSWGEGYTFNADESVVEVIAGEGVEAELYYDKYAEADERRDADITVHHNYTTYLTTVVDGEVRTLTVKEGPEVEAYEGLKAGDAFAAIAQPVYNGNEFTQITAEDDLSVVLQPGTNAAIVIEYEREVSELVDTDYSVDYEYRTYVMTVNEAGEAGYWDAPEVAADAAGGAGYVGQKVILDAKAVEGFAPLPTNPALVQILTDGENHWDFVYERYIPLAPGSVVVNHHYKTTTVAVNGTASESNQSVYGTPVVKYIGEGYTAEAILNGFEQTGVSVDAVAAEPAESVSVTVGELTVIDFYYEKTEDFSVPVTYSVAHEYYLYDWDGSLLNESKPEPVTGTGFATNPLVVAPETTDYTLTSATYNGVEMESYTIILSEGENRVVFVYEKTLPRDFVDVTVIHNYYKDEAAMQAEVPTPENQYTAVTANLPESSAFTAEIRDLEGYEFHSAAPASMTITVTEDGENVIVLNYIRCEAVYEVVHVYYGNGEFEGRTAETFGGLHGEVVTGESIARVPVYDGNQYSFVSVSGDIVLDSNGKQTIELVYERTFAVLVPTSYSVAHEYYLYDWDGTLLNESKPAPVVREGYVGETVTVSPKAEGYTLIAAAYNGAALEGSSIVLQEGENEVVFTYEKVLARDSDDVLVIHEYYASVDAEEPEKVAEELFTDIPEGSRFTAETRIEAGYEFHAADPALTIVVEDNGENVIVIKYVRKAAAYKVIHVYMVNGGEEGRTSQRFTGLHGELVESESIDRVNEYNGKRYHFVSATGDILLDADAEQTITLVYNRSTGGGGSKPKDPTPDPIEIPEEPVPLTPAPEGGDEPIEIPDEEVPLANVPKTGDESFKLILMALASALGLAGLTATRKREEEME